MVENYCILRYSNEKASHIKAHQTYSIIYLKRRLGHPKRRGARKNFGLPLLNRLWINILYELPVILLNRLWINILYELPVIPEMVSLSRLEFQISHDTTLCPEKSNSLDIIQ